MALKVRGVDFERANQLENTLAAAKTEVAAAQTEVRRFDEAALDMFPEYRPRVSPKKKPLTSTRAWEDIAKGSNPLDARIYDLNISVRLSNCLANQNIWYVGDLVKKTERELRKAKNLGARSLTEVRNVLAEKGLSLGMAQPEWKRPKDPWLV